MVPQGAMADEEEESFAALFAESEAKEKGHPRIAAGDQVRGRIVSIGSSAAFVAIGAKAEAMIDLAELVDSETGERQLGVGDEIEAHVTDDGRTSGTIVLRRTMGRGARAGELEQAHAHGIAVEGLVTGQNKGGYEVQIGGLRAFCPASQIDVRRGDPDAYVGQRFRFRITKIESHGRNVVVSRRDVLEAEAAELAAVTWERLRVGAVVAGTVVSLRDFGAFVDLGGVEGLIHLSELGYARPEHPSEVLQVGQRVEAQVIKIEPGAEGRRGRIGLSLRALAPDPWREVPERFPVGAEVRGVVQRLEQFGAFVQLAPGIEGLVHVSQMALDRRIAHPRQVVEAGQEVSVTVLAVEPEKRRIGLSMSARARHERDAEQAAERAETDELVAQSNQQSRSLGTFADLLRSSQEKKRH
jgi:small subunit ribosomal protein S1